jgi:hypothetical protein
VVSRRARKLRRHEHERSRPRRRDAAASALARRWPGCITCRWVEVKLCRNGALGLGCTHPMACYGQAGRGKNCCSWEREPGADDQLGA